LAQATVLEAVAQAKREFLQVPGIVGIGYVGNTIIFYVETPEDVGKVPVSYMGYPVVARVVGRVRLL
jgi:hypothetical protein